MKKSVMVLKQIKEETEDKQAQYHAEPAEIELNAIKMISTLSRTVVLDGQIVKLSNRSFKDVKKDLFKTKCWDRIIVL